MIKLLAIMMPAAVILGIAAILIMIGGVFDFFHPPPPPLTSAQHDKFDAAFECASPHREKLNDLQSIERFKRSGVVDREAILSEDAAVS
ncbi:MAG TPA: hypothetical protein VHY35_13795, partial [Stellaceae bacterium]|nr:hypothetical protein [Stellaceae bacterium]